MSRKKIEELIIDIQVYADMSKDWLNRNNIGKEEIVWGELENIIESTEKIRRLLISEGGVK